MSELNIEELEDEIKELKDILNQKESECDTLKDQIEYFESRLGET